MLAVVMLSVVMLSVVMLSVEASAQKPLTTSFKGSLFNCRASTIKLFAVVMNT
jgi:hypothetical protein